MNIRLISVIGFGAMFAFAVWFFSNAGNAIQHRSDSPLGYLGLLSFLDSRGMDIEVSRHPPNREMRDQFARILIEPRIIDLGQNFGGQLNKTVLRRKIDNVPTIIVFPKWRQARGQVGVVAREDLIALVEGITDYYAFNEAKFSRRLFPDLRKLQQEPEPNPLVLAPQGVLELPPDFTPLITEGRYILAAKWVREGYPTTLIFFDPDLVSNHGLANGQHADLVIPEIEDLVGYRTLMVDRSTWEPARESRFSQRADRPREARDVNRLFQAPFIYIWIAFAILVGLTFWAFVGRGEGVSLGPEELQSSPSLKRRLDRMARIWSRHVPADQVYKLYERALFSQTAKRLGLRVSEAACLKTLQNLEETRYKTTTLKDWMNVPSSANAFVRLQTLRRILHDL